MSTFPKIEMPCSYPGCDQILMRESTRTGKINYCTAHKKIARAEKYEKRKGKEPVQRDQYHDRQDAYVAIYDPAGAFRGLVRALEGWKPVIQQNRRNGMILRCKDTNKIYKVVKGELVEIKNFQYQAPSTPIMPAYHKGKSTNGMKVKKF